MKIALLLLLGLLCARSAGAQVYSIDTIRFNGDPAHHINIVILGDGYTESEQTNFQRDAQRLSDYLLSNSPWDHYGAYFNVFGIGVASMESGASHPNTASDCGSTGVPVIAVNTYFGCSFDAFGIHRLVVPKNTVAISALLAATFPDYDQVLMLANSPYYGGSGGSYATATLNTASAEIVAHELGHSFGFLADEYWAGPQYAAEKPNMTRESDPGAIRWANWLTPGTGVNIYPYSGDPTWFKPSESCKMQALSNPYCSVCSEALIERIHALVNPIVAYSPRALTTEIATQPVRFRLDTLVCPSPNTLRTEWTLDGVSIGAGRDSCVIHPSALSSGTHTLEVSVLDTTSLVRTDDHFTAHISRVTWDMDKREALVSRSTSSRISLALFPDPAQTDITIRVESEKPEAISVAIVSADGRTVWTGESSSLTSSFVRNIPLTTLPAGGYSVVFHIGAVTEMGRFIRR